ncbi:uncharacterized protein LODBEIA_P35330 [Lodderomyces beijingensis]|uniref:t-SNARE coiled-coil homology domain-containing protein n=1 Tax=Lodderomyces beijingensis TaxID=1775926 RepID=A0ABP0ZMD8_9ASCO
MSFANIDLEAQRQPLLKSDQPTATYASDDAHDENGQVPGSNTLDFVIQKTSRSLQGFSQSLSQFDSQRRQLGTKRDSLELRTNTDALQSNISKLQRAIETLIGELSLLMNKSAERSASGGSNAMQVSGRQIIMKERLTAEFHELVKKFAKLSKLYADKKRVTPVADAVANQENNNSSGDASGSSSKQQHQQQVQLLEQEQEDPDIVEQTELQYHLLLTEERNQEIQQVADGIMEVNSIFKDLGQLLNRQGEQINTIEDNILQLHGHTQQADRELQKANAYQRKRGKWSCILLVAVSIFLLVVILAVLS